MQKLFSADSTFNARTDFIFSTFNAGAYFSSSAFNAEANFSSSIFNAEAYFNSIFNARTDFSSSAFNAEAYFNSTFNARADFGGSTFNAEAYFNSIFNARADFGGSTFNAEAYFGSSTFDALADFGGSTFNTRADFSSSTFNAGAYFSNSTFNTRADFGGSTFNAEAVFSRSTFNTRADFGGSTFNAEAVFSNATFNAEADFRNARFKNNADFRYISVDSQPLVFDNTTWEKRIDLRGMSVKELQWDNTHNPSDVKGVVDFREAQIGSATVKEVRFQDLVDFSRMTVGQYGERIYGPPTKAQWKMQQAFWASRPLMHFENNTFENEVDFLHIKLHVPLRLIRNRFRSTFDLTGTTFEAQHSGLPLSTKATPRLCLSYNRINRLVFESKHLDRVKSVDAPECQNAANAVNPSDNINQNAEPLASVSKSLEKAFSDVNDRRGVNEAWYLATVAARDQTDRSKPTIGSIIWTKISWVFGDVPSRYTVDVGRTVWVSSIIIIVFAGVYLFYFLLFDAVAERWQALIIGSAALNRLFDRAKRPKPSTNKAFDKLSVHSKSPKLADEVIKVRWHLVNKKADARPDKTRVVMMPALSERQRAFRLRLFESIHRQQEQHARGIQPIPDAMVLSMRAFTKLGMGTVYPNERVLKWLTSLEWALGIFMLIHFILAVKNNLPFILPFLGVAN